ncbi:hypothetical protein [Flavobacterium sp. KACC 22763]|uniref:hypothetical protein n=1 Tax=Flavobacterium sp. KACC 22763 TaxID=3025668 RepID=UPI002365C043|nr:hypothetical protein [Flavobacterium sp. KACC 22763]WDF62627.1 hypothetical protein PQ463_13475 [Flavobacterium sp. KACC 22763]
MSDWNTLHFFDDKTFYTKVVPDLLGKGELLKKHFESKLGNNILWDNRNSKERIDAILKFCHFFDKDFKVHQDLYALISREKKPGEQYLEALHAIRKDEKEFKEQNSQVIDDLTEILPLLIFSECASFNPHLILGRNIFRSRVNARPKSAAAEIITRITDQEYGSVFPYNSGIVNWVTNDDLQLLWMDKESLFSTDADSEDYFQEFLKFIEIAIENNLGVISGSNMKESILNSIKKPILAIDLDLEALALSCIINYK